jgi:hypothetical protein
MLPASAVFAKSSAGRAAARTRLVCIEQVHGAAGCSEYGMSQNFWSPAATGRNFESEQGKPRVARALPQAPHHRQQHRHAHGRGVRAGRSGRRPFPVERRDVHARAPEADGGIGRARRHVDGSTLRKEGGQDTPIPSMQLSIEPSISPVDARTATRASIPTPSAGPRPINRCRWCAIRAWCSS